MGTTSLEKVPNRVLKLYRLQNNAIVEKVAISSGCRGIQPRTKKKKRERQKNPQKTVVIFRPNYLVSQKHGPPSTNATD